MIKLKTAADRFSRAVRSIDSWCRDNRHISLSEQQQRLNEKLRCHYATRVLRCYGQLRGLIEVPLGSSAALAEVALSPQSHALDELGPFPAPAPALPAGRRAHRAFGLQACSKPVI